MPKIDGHVQEAIGHFSMRAFACVTPDGNVTNTFGLHVSYDDG